MSQEKFNYWGETTAGSSCRWREDTITRLDGWGVLYYMGDESGAFIKVSPEGMLQMGTYEEAMPRIGEAIFTIKTEKNCDSFSTASQRICQLSNRAFLTDIFSNDRVPLNMRQSAQSTIVQEDRLSLDTEEAKLKNNSAASM